MAKWDKGLFGGHESSDRAARVEFFCKHTIEFQGVKQTTTLASLSWFKNHPKMAEFGNPITVWYHDLFEADGIHSLVPVQFIVCRCVAIVDKLDSESVLFVCPCIDF